MSVIRVEKTTNYTVMSNYHFKEKEMSLKAKGLLSLMLSLPTNWDYSIAGLVAICKENETSIKTALDELKEFGYLEVIKKMPNETKTGRIEYEYIVYEKKQEGKKQDLENLGVENLDIENPVQCNNNQLNTKKLNKKEIYNNIIVKFGFSESIINALYEWLDYKKEKNQTYKEKGLEALCKSLLLMKNNNSDEFVVNAINHSMCQNYAGIYPRTNNISTKNNNVFRSREYTKEQMNDMFDDLDNIEI